MKENRSFPVRIDVFGPLLNKRVKGGTFPFENIQVCAVLYKNESQLIWNDLQMNTNVFEIWSWVGKSE